MYHGITAVIKPDVVIPTRWMGGGAPLSVRRPEVNLLARASQSIVMAIYISFLTKICNRGVHPG